MVLSELRTGHRVELHYLDNDNGCSRGTVETIAAPLIKVRLDNGKIATVRCDDIWRRIP